jgi:hypothetical protein
MPTVSRFKFPPPSDPIRWRRAQAQAASGEQILLKEIIKVFPNSYDFLDGDRSFRRLHLLIDIFVDAKHGLEPLTKQYSFYDEIERRRRHLLANEGSRVSDALTTTRQLQDEELDPDKPDSDSDKPNPNKPPKYVPYTVDGKQVVPDPYNYRYNMRAPIVQIGYSAFQKDWNSYFSGNFLGGNFISRNDFLHKWSKTKDNIAYPFIAVCALNENWGMLSTMYPNRTAKWGQCCNRPSDKLLYEFLDHPKTLALAINQHSNVSHPKVIMIPRGLPLQWANTHHLLWDAMRYSEKNVKKKKLLYVSASSWGPSTYLI